MTGVIAMPGALGAEPATAALVAMYDRAFLLGPGTIPAVNAPQLERLPLRANQVRGSGR